MTYLAFLLMFLIVPILVLGLVVSRDQRRGHELPASLRLMSPWLVLAILTVVAVTYTTPWDNYLVATRVWWYDPALVTGITLGWVPLEEYAFFVLQTVLMSLWLFFLARRIPVASPFKPRPGLRKGAVGVIGLIWAASVLCLLAGWKWGNYLALELAWALPPIALQLAFGADILWRYRWLVVLGIVSATFYLSGMDALAIHSGTWTINPERSLGILLGGVLPVEEFVFFLLTNTLLVFGMVLALANESMRRLPRHTIKLLIRQHQHSPL